MERMRWCGKVEKVEDTRVDEKMKKAPMLLLQILHFPRTQSTCIESYSCSTFQFLSSCFSFLSLVFFFWPLFSSPAQTYRIKRLLNWMTKLTLYFIISKVLISHILIHTTNTASMLENNFLFEWSIDYFYYYSCLVLCNPNNTSHRLWITSDQKIYSQIASSTTLFAVIQKWTSWSLEKKEGMIKIQKFLSFFHWWVDPKYLIWNTIKC